jgi:methionyl-tRNA formyltransferase
MARRSTIEVPADLRAHLEAARLDLLALFRALDRLNLAPSEIPQPLIRRLFDLDADYAEALWALDQPPGTLDLMSLLRDTLAALLREYSVGLVCLAGYMRLLSAPFIKEFAGRILNIHPSLLPAFPGLDAQRQALEAGVKVSGCTVALVDEMLDHGPILLQRTVPVLPGDTVETLSARILEQEHRLYPEALALIASR